MRLFIHTIGCQMNVYDSQKMAAVLKPSGCRLTKRLEDADIVIVNTCSVREKAEQKAFSFLGRMAQLKKSKPELIIGVGGCVAQQEKTHIFERIPEVDLVFGTHAIGRLAELVDKVAQKRCQIVDTAIVDTIEEITPQFKDPAYGKVSEFVTIMQGCDNFCTYCVVPHVRGSEISRNPDDILNEIDRLVDAGVKEVTLLGQNVNSYGIKEGLCSFVALLRQINEIEGLRRIRFTTSHPKDLSSQLIEAFSTCEKLCSHIHLPFQSGSNRILNRMNRHYTREDYMEKIGLLTDARPLMGITSDVIVGFPGETEEDFSMTVDLIQSVQFNSLYAFKYSDRPFTAASRFNDKVSESEKTKRIQNVLDLQRKITIEKHNTLVESNQSVLVEGFSKKQMKETDALSHQQWTGRTPSNIVVNFTVDRHILQNQNDSLTGKIVDVRILKAFPHSLWGSLENQNLYKFNRLKGESDAA
jgi:tRNA-2-methylthio-N6-dimethylallyladenosine synthase